MSAPSDAPSTVRMQRISVAGREGMLFNLGGAHAVTRKRFIPTDGIGNTGVGDGPNWTCDPKMPGQVCQAINSNRKAAGPCSHTAIKKKRPS